MTPFMFFYCLGAAVTVALSWRGAMRAGWKQDRVAAAIVACVLGAVIGSKVFMFDFHRAAAGEKTLLGALLGGVVALALVVRPLGFDHRAFDVAALPAVCGAAIGRIGCVLAGCCHGIPTTLPWGVRYANTPLPVHPTQLYEALLDAILAVVLVRSRHRLTRPGSLALSAGAGFGAIRFVVDPLRESAVHAGPLTVVQWTLLGLGLATSTWLLRRGVGAMKAPTVALSPRLALVSMAALAFVAFGSLTPVERMVVAGVVIGAGPLVAREWFRHFTPVAPLAATALFLPLSVQQGEGAATTRGRASIAFGAGATAGGYEVTREDCEGNPISRAQHTYGAAALLAEYGVEYSPGVGRTLRLLGFVGEDNSTAAKYVSAPPTTPAPYDSARHDPMVGVSASATIDWRWVGVTLGSVSGRLAAVSDYPRYDGGLIPARHQPIIGLRFGSLSAGFFDVGYLTHPLGPVPDHRFSIGLGRGEPTGRRTVRAGVSESSGYLSARWLSEGGLEFEPYISLGPPRRYHFAAVVKKRFSSRF